MRFYLRTLLPTFIFCLVGGASVSGQEEMGPEQGSLAGPGVDDGAVEVKRSETKWDPAPKGSAAAESRAGSVTTGYCLVENQPRCYYTLGTAYCPAPPGGKSFTELYMAGVQRTSQVLANAARMDPSGFKAKYMSGAAYACSVAAVNPLRYNANLQQASQQQSRIINDPNCGMQHDTCSSYCNLYGNSCVWYDRIGTYEPNWMSIGENLAMTYESDANNPISALLIWFGSSGHCKNIFSTDNDHMGTGSTSRYWVQNFAQVSATTSNPLHDGSHWVDSSLTGGKLRFLVNYAAGAAPQSISVVIDGATYTMSLHLGSASRGTYFYDRAAPASTAPCIKYYFTVTTGGAAYTLPETGAYQTTGVGTCGTNWIANRGAAAGGTSTSTTKAPTRRPTKAPTRRPTKVPTKRPTKRPTKAPVRV